jgi:isoquinoline 1-oxidoreductase
MISINPGRAGVESPYHIEKKESAAIECAPPLRHGSYRALASTANNFARESAMDDLAALAGADPLQFRLDHLDKDSRVRGVLEALADEWAKKRLIKSDKPLGYGIACGTDKGGYVAAIAVVEVDKVRNAIKVLHVTQAFDCGAVMNPSNLRSQNMGAIIQGLGPALREAMEFENGKISNASFWKYEVPRMVDVPQIEIKLIDRPDVPSAGAGETPLIAIAPAIRNAVRNLTKQSLSAMPLRLSPVI